MIYGPQTPAGERFPWKVFLDRTELPRSFFKKLFGDEGFLETVAEEYETKGSLLNDQEVFRCVEKVYFSMFKKCFINEDIFWVGAFIPEIEGKEQPHIEGFAYENDDSELKSERMKLFRRAVEVLSKELYGDSHAWFKDFEDYFRKQNEEHI